jgi:hypothetical protein
LGQSNGRMDLPRNLPSNSSASSLGDVDDNAEEPSGDVFVATSASSLGDVNDNAAGSTPSDMFVVCREVN